MLHRQHTWLSDMDVNPPIFTDMIHYRCELKLRYEAFQEGVDLAAAAAAIDARVCLDPLTEAWKGCGLEIFGEGCSAKIQKAMWLRGDPAVAKARGEQIPLERTLLLEFVLPSRALLFQEFTKKHTNWEAAFYTELWERFQTLERRFLHWSSGCVSPLSPVAGLRVIEAEFYSWDALDQHPGHRSAFFTAAKEEGQE